MSSDWLPVTRGCLVAKYPLLHGPLQEQRPCQSNNRCCFRNFFFCGTMSYFALYDFTPRVRATLGVVSVKFWGFGVAVAREGAGYLAPLPLKNDEEK